MSNKRIGDYNGAFTIDQTTFTEIKQKEFGINQQFF